MDVEAKIVTQTYVTVRGDFTIVLIMTGIQNCVIVTNTMNVTVWEENYYENFRKNSGLSKCVTVSKCDCMGGDCMGGRLY